MHDEITLQQLRATCLIAPVGTRARMSGPKGSPECANKTKKLLCQRRAERFFTSGLRKA
jgi:hypothetical protein